MHLTNKKKAALRLKSDCPRCRRLVETITAVLVPFHVSHAPDDYIEHTPQHSTPRLNLGCISRPHPS